MGFLDKITKVLMPRNFKYMHKLIHKGKKEIVLDSDIIISDDEARDIYRGIEIDVDDIIIDGNGKTIDAAGKSRIFLITADNITLKNIIFKNGNVQKNYDNQINSLGGAIRINYNNSLTIRNCEFLNNSSLNGGAIHNKQGTLTIIESALNNNDNAITNSGGEVNISNSQLNNNKRAIYNIRHCWRKT
jgi:iron uptake system EfeUOB component EfeO/EfeM